MSSGEVISLSVSPSPLAATTVEEVTAPPAEMVLSSSLTVTAAVLPSSIAPTTEAAASSTPPTGTVHVLITSYNEEAGLHGLTSNYNNDDNNYLFNTDYYGDDADNDLHDVLEQHNQPEMNRAPTPINPISSSPQRSTDDERDRTVHIYCPGPRAPVKSTSAPATLLSIFRPTSIDVDVQLRMPLVTIQSISVLDAPNLADDHCLNLLDWSSTNLLGVGLGRDVYIWNVSDRAVIRLDEVEPEDFVTSLSWAPQVSNRLYLIISFIN
jgi:hypothetical protein